MARPLRILYKNAWYHVMNRGLSREDIFLDDKHRQMFLHVLAEVVEKFKVEIHAYCLMDNHYHLMIKTPLANLDKAMRHLNSVYTIRYNKSVKSDGPIFRGRYKSILVEEESYLLELHRYIHRNPSSAKMVMDGLDKKYPWSSYQYYLMNGKKIPKLLKTEHILNLFKNSTRKYVNFIEGIIENETLDFYKRGRTKPIFGSEGFIDKIISKYFKNSDPHKEVSERKEIINRKYPTLDEIIEEVSVRYSLDKEEIKSKKYVNNLLARRVAIYVSDCNPKYSSIDIAMFFGGLNYSSISKSVSRFKVELSKNKSLAKEITALLKKLGLNEN
jgi:putative transposase